MKVIKLTQIQRNALSEIDPDCEQEKKEMFVDAYAFSVVAAPNQIVILDKKAFTGWLYDVRKELKSYVFRYRDERRWVFAINGILKKSYK